MTEPPAITPGQIKAIKRLENQRDAARLSCDRLRGKLYRREQQLKGLRWFAGAVSLLAIALVAASYATCELPGQAPAPLGRITQ